MGLFARILEEWSARPLHAAMSRAANRRPPVADQGLFEQLSRASLWAVTVGPAPDWARLSETGRIFGSATVQFRAGRTPDGESFLPAATTRRRLLRGVNGEAGDTMVKLPFRFLAGAARAAGVDSLVINPGTVPLGRIAGPVLASFADGAVPDAERPDRIARIGEGSQAPLQPLADVDLPAGLIDALIEVLQRDPGVRRAVLGVRPMGEAMAFTVFVNRDGVDQGHITEKLADVAIHQIGEPNYFAAVFVDDSAAELNDPERTIDLV